MIFNQPTAQPMGYIGGALDWNSGHDRIDISQIRGIAYAPAIDLDCNLANDFTIQAITGDLALTLINAQFGTVGSVIVRQDPVGGRLVTLAISAAVATIMRDSSVADLAAAPGANAFTIYTWRITGVFPTAIMVVGKILPVTP